LETQLFIKNILNF